ncbi:MAG: hypothetical protein H7230_04465 [Candidatus Parcubacteria bacterium]|nr:hypothetical protein [Candidatus Paceibacterota bacterium]
MILLQPNKFIPESDLIVRKVSFIEDQLQNGFLTNKFTNPELLNYLTSYCHVYDDDFDMFLAVNNLNYESLFTTSTVNELIRDENKELMFKRFIYICDELLKKMCNCLQALTVSKINENAIEYYDADLISLNSADRQTCVNLLNIPMSEEDPESILISDFNYKEGIHKFCFYRTIGFINDLKAANIGYLFCGHEDGIQETSNKSYPNLFPSNHELSTHLEECITQFKNPSPIHNFSLLSISKVLEAKLTEIFRKEGRNRFNWTAKDYNFLIYNILQVKNENREKSIYDELVFIQTKIHHVGETNTDGKTVFYQFTEIEYRWRWLFIMDLITILEHHQK